MSKIEARNTWIAQRLGNVPSDTLREMFAEIADYQKNGILLGDLMRELDREFSNAVLGGEPSSNLRLVENAVLFEIGRRFYNMGKDGDDVPSIKSGDTIWYVDKEKNELEKGKVCSVVTKDGTIESFSVDFVESGDFDEFVGSALGTDFFLLKELAEEALRN